MASDSGQPVAVIADTHGLLRLQVLDLLDGTPLIIHAGDVGKPGILDTLREIAPVRVVRGNVDRGDWARTIPDIDRWQWQGHHLHMVHRREDVHLAAEAVAPDLIIVGHSHQPLLSDIDGICCLNPGSIGPRRFSLPISMAWWHPAGGPGRVDKSAITFQRVEAYT